MIKFTETVLPYRIILADADRKTSDELENQLRKSGFDPYCSNTGTETLDLARRIIPHIILCEVVFSDMDGIELCKDIKEFPALKDTVVVFYTTRSEDYTQIAAFNAGADDYLFKPMRPRVLSCRLYALLKRVEPEFKPANALVTVGELKIDMEHFVVLKNSEKIELPKKEFKLLSLLATKPGKVFSRDVIIKEVWKDEITTTDRTIDVHIRRLRSKIGDNYITTIKGIGYKLNFAAAL